MGAPATGEQHVLTRNGAHGPVTATVTELAAGLRRVRVGDTELVQDYPADALPSQGSGIVLVPWPNRVRAGRWTLDGVPQQLDLTEPALGNASHGLLRNTGYRVTDRSDGAITLAASVFPQHGYPFHLDTEVRYTLNDSGLDVTHTIRNVGGGAAPVGIGVHPYLRVGDVPTRSLTASVPADTMLEADEHKIPISSHPVDGTPYDLRGGGALAGLDLDTAFTDLQLVSGRHRHRLTAPDGTAVELAADPDFGYVQLFTSSIYATDDGPIDAVAVEPMTCAPDALNSGAGLRWLHPGEVWTTGWSVALIPR